MVELLILFLSLGVHRPVLHPCMQSIGMKMVICYSESILQPKQQETNECDLMY